MCLAIPGKVVNIEGDTAVVDYGGVTSEANVSMVNVNVGQYVIVHAGFAIQILDEDEAKKTIELWEEILESDSAARENAKNA